MGGSGGNFIPTSTPTLQHKIHKARQEEQEKLDSQVNDFLRTTLIEYNDRDIDITKKRIDDLSNVLGDETEIESMLFGGSVAKHTYVDGLSDIDALMLLDRKNTQGLSSQDVLSKMHDNLEIKLKQGDVQSIEKGKLAVTIKYNDGSEIQVLPAVKSGKEIRIPASDGLGWNKTKPHIFHEKLTNFNKKLDNALVPTIKLVKSLVSDLPKQQQLSGYHIESIAIDAAASYSGPNTARALLMHILDHATERSRTPMKDITGQSRNVDDYLGKADSTQRKLASQGVAGIKRRLNAATSLSQWKAMFGSIEK